jgi:hypothetical protein
MPRYVIERQFLVPIFEHMLVEAASLEAACRLALDEHAVPWGDDSQICYDDARPTTIAQAVEMPDDLRPNVRPENPPDHYELSALLYDCGLDLLRIPSELGEERRTDEPIGFS